MTGKPKVLLLYPYYWPFYKAGGPVQSIFNIAATFVQDCQFYVIALNRDIDSTEAAPSVSTGAWTIGPNGEHIYFMHAISPLELRRLISDVNPDTIFINGIFNANTTMPGVFWGKVFGKRVIISPRGMLQEWALKRHSYKKKIYLALLSFLIDKKIEWHATDDSEANDIGRVFGRGFQIHVASNIPRKVNVYTELLFPEREGRIRLVFLSLINRNKNLHIIIDSVMALTNRFELDIYGPVIDKEYWQFCEMKFSNCDQINYKGPIPPWQVPDLLSKYHFFVLPTQGENFGHAIFDSLASGVPVIISKNTPWKMIDQKDAGFYIDLKYEDSLKDLLQSISGMDQAAYNRVRLGSVLYASEFWKSKNYLADYRFLLGAN